MTTIPEGADGLVIAGVAGQGGQEYAADTDDLIKILAESKITLVYDREGDRDRLVLKSADWWGQYLCSASKRSPADLATFSRTRFGS